MFFVIILVLGLLVLMLCAQGRLLSKAGENPWKILIPFYGNYLYYRAANCPGLFFGNIAVSVLTSLLGNVPVVLVILGIISLIMAIMFNVSQAHAYGKSGGFAVGLLFLPYVFLPILAFGDSQHESAARSASQPVTVSTWRCPVCGASQPASRLSCSECGTKRP